MNSNYNITEYSGLSGYAPFFTVVFFILLLVLNYISLKHLRNKVTPLGRNTDTSNRKRYTFLYRMNLAVIALNLMLLIYVAVVAL